MPNVDFSSYSVRRIKMVCVQQHQRHWQVRAQMHFKKKQAKLQRRKRKKWQLPTFWFFFANLLLLSVFCCSFCVWFSVVCSSCIATLIIYLFFFSLLMPKNSRTFNQFRSAKMCVRLVGGHWTHKCMNLKWDKCTHTHTLKAYLNHYLLLQQSTINYIINNPVDMHTLHTHIYTHCSLVRWTKPVFWEIFLEICLLFLLYCTRFAKSKNEKKKSNKITFRLTVLLFRMYRLLSTRSNPMRKE